jgi:PRC-barrel domain
MLRPCIPGAVAAALLATAPAVPAAFAQAQEGRRSSQIIGSTVYNDSDERIGTVDDLIVGQDGRLSEAVLSVGGFLGIGTKLVAVPYGELRFEPRGADRITDGPSPAARVAAPVVPDPRTEERWRTGVAGVGTAAPVEPAPEAGGGPGTASSVARLAAGPRLVLPGATQASLRSLPEFNYGR